MAQRGEPGDVFFVDRVSVAAHRVDGVVQVSGVPQHDGVEGEAERDELVFLAPT